VGDRVRKLGDLGLELGDAALQILGFWHGSFM
jgi:hypothetical protein